LFKFTGDKTGKFNSEAPGKAKHKK
jgi:hypothetical protein